MTGKRSYRDSRDGRKKESGNLKLRKEDCEELERGEPGPLSHIAGYTNWK
jgi:hypothetical protein